MAEKIRIKGSKYNMEGNYEPSDSEDDYAPAEKKLLEKIRKKNHHDSNSEEELYAFTESEEESDKNDLIIADSDVEGQEQSDDDLPDVKAWGKKKRSYYATDYVDEDYGGFGNEEEAALMEEQETKIIQKRLLEHLDGVDFSHDFFAKNITDAKQIETIESDMSKISQKQKIQFEKDSPEYAGLVDDFKTKLTVAKDDLHPVLELVKDGTLPKCSASKFVKTNYDLILNYCTNISFYLLLKSKKVDIQNHPVTKRLYQYRQMLNKMEPIYLEVIKPQVDKILHAVKNNLKLQVIKVEEKKRKSGKLSPEPYSKKLKLMSVTEKDDGEDTGVSDDNENSDNFKTENIPAEVSQSIGESDESGFSDNNENPLNDLEINSKPISSVQSLPIDDFEEKRKITYQIAKNKGLTPHRKKEQRNPRVKHKLKYRKAKIRRKGAVREPRTETSRYGGEASGIKANLKKSIKIK